MSSYFAEIETNCSSTDELHSDLDDRNISSLREHLIKEFKFQIAELGKNILRGDQAENFKINPSLTLDTAFQI